MAILHHNPQPLPLPASSIPRPEALGALAAPIPALVRRRSHAPGRPRPAQPLWPRRAHRAQHALVQLRRGFQGRLRLPARPPAPGEGQAHLRAAVQWHRPHRLCRRRRDACPAPAAAVARVQRARTEDAGGLDPRVHRHYGVETEDQSVGRRGRCGGYAGLDQFRHLRHHERPDVWRAVRLPQG